MSPYASTPAPLPDSSCCKLLSRDSKNVTFAPFSFVISLLCNAMLARYMLCPSACLSVTSWSSMKMAKPRITQTMQYDSPGILVYWCQRSQRTSRPWKTGKIVSKMTYNVSSGTLNPTIPQHTILENHDTRPCRMQEVNSLCTDSRALWAEYCIVCIPYNTDI